MTLKVYWAQKIAGDRSILPNCQPVYLAADVDKVVEENATLKSDIARVTEELKKAKEYISGKYGLGILYPVTGEIVSAQREWKGDKP